MYRLFSIFLRQLKLISAYLVISVKHIFMIIHSRCSHDSVFKPMAVLMIFLLGVYTSSSFASTVALNAVASDSLHTLKAPSPIAKAKNFAQQIVSYSGNLASVLTSSASTTNMASSVDSTHQHNPDVVTPAKVEPSTSNGSGNAQIKDERLLMPPIEFTPLVDQSARLSFSFLNLDQAKHAISPLGLHSVFAMLAHASTGPSSVEIYRLFGSESMAKDILNRQYPLLLSELKHKSENQSGLYLFNQILLNQKIAAQVDTKYLKEMKQKYLADPFMFDTTVPHPEKQINQQVATQTKGKISNLLPENSINSSTQVVMTNTLGFKGLWLQPFEEKNTQLQPFYGEDGIVLEPVKTMSQILSLKQGNLNGYMIYDIPYQGDEFIFRAIVLPEGKKLSEMMEFLKQQNWSKLGALLKEQTCILHLPRFKLEPESRSVIKEMKANGVEQVFSTQADFSPMLGTSGKTYYLENVLHSVAMSVDENGTELASATAAIVKTKSLKPMCQISRPFMFSVIDKKTSAMMVLGFIKNPN